MINPVSNANPPQPTAPTNTASQKTAPSKPQSTTAPSDTVQLSNTAKVALQEATETSYQTQQEANHGDLQAKKLLAKEAAAKQQTSKL